MSADTRQVPETWPGVGPDYVAPPTAALTILVVCAGNQCRSPAVATILKQGAHGLPGIGDHDVRVETAGTVNAPGAPVDPKTVRALRRAGYRPPVTTSCVLTTEMVDRADLVLTASRRHRTAVVRMVPESLRRCYTLREFARLCSAYSTRAVDECGREPAERLRAAMVWVERQRGLVLPRHPDDDDIPDPAGRSRRAHVRVVGRAEDTVTPILAVAFPGRASSGEGRAG